MFGISMLRESSWAKSRSAGVAPNIEKKRSNGTMIRWNSLTCFILTTSVKVTLLENGIAKDGADSK